VCASCDDRVRAKERYRSRQKKEGEEAVESQSHACETRTVSG